MEILLVENVLLNQRRTQDLDVFGGCRSSWKNRKKKIFWRAKKRVVKCRRRNCVHYSNIVMFLNLWFFRHFLFLLFKYINTACDSQVYLVLNTFSKLHNKWSNFSAFFSFSVRRPFSFYFFQRTFWIKGEGPLPPLPPCVRLCLQPVHLWITFTLSSGSECVIALVNDKCGSQPHWSIPSFSRASIRFRRCFEGYAFEAPKVKSNCCTLLGTRIAFSVTRAWHSMKKSMLYADKNATPDFIELNSSASLCKNVIFTKSNFSYTMLAQFNTHVWMERYKMRIWAIQFTTILCSICNFRLLPFAHWRISSRMYISTGMLQLSAICSPNMVTAYYHIRKKNRHSI